MEAAAPALLVQALAFNHAHSLPLWQSFFSPSSPITSRLSSRPCWNPLTSGQVWRFQESH